MFVHEWGHLRWGIFDEYYQSFYGPDFNGVPARCVEKVNYSIVEQEVHISRD